MNRETVEKLKSNPHYKPNPKQLVVDEEDDNIRTFGVLPKQNTVTIPKHPTDPVTVTHKKPIDK